MNRPDLDWVYIRRYTIRPVVSATVAIVILGTAVWLYSEHKQLFRELTANQMAMHGDYDALVEQRRIVNRYHRRYQQFFELGFIGRESRLDWVETMRTTSEQLNLPRLRYSIEPQRSVAAPVSSRVGGENIQIRVSNLQLELGLVHEVDLLRLFDVLQSHAPGLITVDRCELEKIDDSSSGAVEANITAACEVRIFSAITSDISGKTT